MRGFAPAWASVEWTDGETTRVAWVNPVLLAESAPSDDGARAVKALDTGAQRDCPRPRVCLWRLKDAGAVLEALPPGVAARFSRVLHDERSTRAPMRVPLGGVVVALDPKLSRPAKEAWLTARGLIAEQWLAAELLLVRSPAGRPSLELAAKLAREPGVTLATPNWWRPGVAR